MWRSGEGEACDGSDIGRLAHGAFLVDDTTLFWCVVCCVWCLACCMSVDYSQPLPRGPHSRRLCDECLHHLHSMPSPDEGVELSWRTEPPCDTGRCSGSYGFGPRVPLEYSTGGPGGHPTDSNGRRRVRVHACACVRGGAGQTLRGSDTQQGMPVYAPRRTRCRTRRATATATRSCQSRRRPQH